MPQVHHLLSLQASADLLNLRLEFFPFPLTPFKHRLVLGQLRRAGRNPLESRGWRHARQSAFPNGGERKQDLPRPSGMLSSPFEHCNDSQDSSVVREWPVQLRAPTKLADVPYYARPRHA